MIGQGFFIAIVVLAFAGVFIWALVDAIRRPESQFPNGRGKTAWLIGIVVVGSLVAIVYLIVVRQKMGPVRRSMLASRPPDVPPASAPPSS